MKVICKNKISKKEYQYHNVSEVYYADGYSYIIWWTNSGQRMESRCSLNDHDMAAFD